ncbi:MAG TPA: polymer-forming cytoskeletal protein [Rhodanobacteraceae bacterium]
MALWKESVKSPVPGPSDALDFERSDAVSAPQPVAPAPVASAEPAAAAAASKTASESHIAPDLVIEGKIEGAGHVRIAGRFKGDVNVRGDVTIEHGAKVEGSVRAERVSIAGELIGNIETASHVELLQTGALTGDVKSATFSVAKGSKMRGQAEFGWDDALAAAPVTSIHKNGGNGGGNR